MLEVIAGYDPKDELTAFSIGRLPTEPYRSFANERTLNGMRIGIIREHMDKSVLNEADGPAIELTERAIGDLRRIGATIVDPGPGGALFQACIDRYFPLYRNRVFTERYPDRFPVDANGKASADHIAPLVDMYFDPKLVPSGTTIRNIGAAGSPALTKYMLSPLLAGARRCEHQDDPRSDRQIEILSRHPSRCRLHRSQSRARGNEQRAYARSRDHLPGPLRQSASHAAMHGGTEPRRRHVSVGEHSRLYPGRTDRAAVGRQDEFRLGPLGTARHSDTVGAGGFHNARV